MNNLWYYKWVGKMMYLIRRSIAIKHLKILLVQCTPILAIPVLDKSSHRKLNMRISLERPFQCQTCSLTLTLTPFESSFGYGASHA